MVSFTKHTRDLNDRQMQRKKLGKGGVSSSLETVAADSCEDDTISLPGSAATISGESNLRSCHHQPPREGARNLPISIVVSPRLGPCRGELFLIFSDLQSLCLQSVSLQSHSGTGPGFGGLAAENIEHVPLAYSQSRCSLFSDIYLTSRISDC